MVERKNVATSRRFKGVLFSAQKPRKEAPLSKVSRGISKYSDILRAAQDHRSRAMTRIYFTPAQASKYLGLSLRALQRLRQQGGGPPYVRVADRIVRYYEGDLEKWRLGRTFRSNAEEFAKSAAA